MYLLVYTFQVLLYVYINALVLVGHGVALLDLVLCCVFIYFYIQGGSACSSVRYLAKALCADSGHLHHFQSDSFGLEQASKIDIAFGGRLIPKEEKKVHVQGSRGGVKGGKEE